MQQTFATKKASFTSHRNQSTNLYCKSINWFSCGVNIGINSISLASNYNVKHYSWIKNKYKICLSSLCLFSHCSLRFIKTKTNKAKPEWQRNTLYSERFILVFLSIGNTFKYFWLIQNTTIILKVLISTTVFKILKPFFYWIKQFLCRCFQNNVDVCKTFRSAIVNILRSNS